MAGGRAGLVKSHVQCVSAIYTYLPGHTGYREIIAWPETTTSSSRALYHEGGVTERRDVHCEHTLYAYK